MTLTEKMEIFISAMEEWGKDISTTTNTSILEAYYESIGVTRDTSFTNWMYGVAKGIYPVYGSVTRSIRQCRTNHPKWKKKHKQKEVDRTKKEVGY